MTNAKIWTKREHEAWRLPQDLTVSEWADRYRVLDPMISAEPGQWTTDRTPYLREPMNCIQEPDVENIVLMMSTQVGKTECMLNMLGYQIDQDPAPIMWVMPKEADARGICEDRIEPMCRLSPALADQFTGKDHDVRKLKIAFRRMILYIQGANSPSGLASKPIRILLMDEIDKYAKFSGSEADPIKLAEERTRTFWNRKKVKCSTPKTEEDYIWPEYHRTDQRRCYVPCPHCGEFQYLVWGQVKWPKDVRDPDEVKNKKLARYECRHCKKMINDQEKQGMLPKCVWVPKGAKIDKDGKITGASLTSRNRGYWINALYSPWLTFSEVAAEFLACFKNGEVQANVLMNFFNSWLAEPWRETIEGSSEDDVAKLARPYKRKTVPDPVLIITAGVDVQQDHFWYVVRGWGYGSESWLIDCGRLETWDEIIATCFQTNYEKAGAGEIIQTALTCIDSGFRTDEVYDVVHSWRNVARATKGMSRPTGQPFSMTRIDRHTRTGQVLKAGLALYSLDTKFFKDKVARLMSVDEPQESKFHIFKDPPRNYLRQMSAESKVKEKDRTGRLRFVWKKKSAGAANHLWDCEVYAAAAAQMLRVHTLRKPGEAETAEAPRPDQNRSQKWVNRNTRGSWVRRG